MSLVNLENIYKKVRNMSYFWILAILSFIVGLIAYLVWFNRKKDDISLYTWGFAFIMAVAFLIGGISQSISLRRLSIRQEKERQQIVYQITNLSNETDKIKLNEWILTYNDWVNDINADIATYGWFSWYYLFDLSKHTIINLV